MLPAELIPHDYFAEMRREEIFPAEAGPLEVDLGCGDGTFLVQMARQYPERCFLGVERLLGRVTKVKGKITRMGLKNCRILRLESAYTVGWLLPSRSVARLHLLCPDPWPKTKHHRRRLVVDEEFHGGLKRVLGAEGEFLLKTDDAAYAACAEEHVGALPWLTRLSWEEQAFFYPTTDFERHWLASGRSIHRARWQLNKEDR
jgi:tRNA (guanine-N7-)-methyltransferase